MKVSALITSLVLGISSVAAAAPGAPVNAVAAARFAPPIARPLPARWMLLDTAKPSRFGRTVVDVNTKLRFTKLKLEAVRGVASIDKVLVTYGNGRTQTIEVDKRLGGWGAQSSAILDLNGAARQITKIVVIGKTTGRSSYSISAA